MKNADSLALFASASELLLRGTTVDKDTGKLTTTAATKRSIDDDLSVGNATAAVDIDALLARAAMTIGLEGREWKVEDRLGRRV
jgi:hypothetical protein